MYINENTITKILNKLGITPNKDGYRYLIDCILLCNENEEYIYNITTKLYPILSKKYSKRISSIERSIRYAIEIGWMNGDYNFSNELFQYKLNYNKINPSNSLFIATIVEYLKRNYK